jgi:hypothetical protein
MTDQEATDIFIKFPEAIAVLVGNINVATLYITGVNQFLVSKGLYMEFVNYFNEITNKNRGTIQ